MAYKRILTIQDISCVGQCSMTVALPVLSACGHETCVLPTAVLSTHTGGFGKPETVHLKDSLGKFIAHWQKNQISFDAILVGYLGSVEAAEAAEMILDTMLAPDGISIVDPAMADHGKLYSGLSNEYAQKMESLCRRADMMIPNITEAAIFAGIPYQQELTEAYVDTLMNRMNHPCVILTGVGYEKGQTGILVQQGSDRFHFSHRKIGKNCHGTGDLFAACFTGALMQGRSIPEAVEIAADFVCASIENTCSSPAHWYGIKFETVLPELIRRLENE